MGAKPSRRESSRKSRQGNEHHGSLTEGLNADSRPINQRRKNSLPGVLDPAELNFDPKGNPDVWNNGKPGKSLTSKTPPAPPKKPAPQNDYTEYPGINRGCFKSKSQSKSRTVGEAESNSNGLEKPESQATVGKQVGKGKRIVVGLYDYASDTPGDLNFNKGDRLVILREEGDWSLAKHVKNLKEGFVPGNYVVYEKSLDSYDWYHGKITRNRAIKDLHAPGIIRYTFLIRDSTSTDGVNAYALSVLDEDEGHNKTVKHYRIRTLSNNRGFYLTTTTQFSTLEELVNFYRDGTTGEAAKVTLSRPCAKAKPPLFELSRDKWEISRGELEFENKLGEGKFGEVHQGRWRNKPVAIKTLKENSMDPAKFLDEAKLMKQLRHRKLVTLYAVCSTQQPFYIVTELMSNGCLLNYLRNDRGRLISLPNLIDIAGQVADGMMYIEAKGYIHRDLAARNILVGDHNQVKIGDFGLALAAADATNIGKNEKFPIKWTAPEAVRESRFTIKTDVWSFGILLVELTTYGDVPYPGKTNKEALQFVEQGNRHPRPPLCPDVVHDLMLNCWKRNPQDRPTFESLYGAIEDIAIDQGTNGYQ